ncbi:hypothetical protein WA158_001732 [Blastocystis sp. Blastoise]
MSTDKTKPVPKKASEFDVLMQVLKDPRRFIIQILTLATVFFSAWMTWKFLMVLTASESPIVVILSGSMRPGYRRGDVYLLNNHTVPLQLGEIVVYNVKGRNIPIVHRVHVIHETLKNNYYILTKGDNNTVHDVGLYAEGQSWLDRSSVYGKYFIYAPYFGMFTIWITDYPWLKTVILAVMGLFVLTGKD